jgi:hypothetical protein
MSKVQSQSPVGPTSNVQRPKSFRTNRDFGLWTLDFGLVLMLILVFAANSLAQDTKCILKLSDLPESPDLFGFRAGMTTEQVKARVPPIVFGRANEFGVARTSISPDFDPRFDKASFAGIRTVSLDFLDNRLTSIWFGHDGTFKWQSVPDYVKGVSQSLRLPNAWTSWKTRGQRLVCADFEMTVIMVGEGPSFHITDLSAEQMIATRREEKEELESSGGEAASDEILADRQGKVYYIGGCQPAKEIKEKDRVVFKTVEEAVQAGYKLAKSCQ